MTETPFFAPLPSRALIAVGGPDWRSFLQGQLTQDVDTLAPGEARFAALLTPQGRLMYDMFVVGRDEGCWLDVAAEARDALITRLTMYRLRAKVDFSVDDSGVSALFSSFAHPGDCEAEARSSQSRDPVAGAALAGFGAAASPTLTEPPGLDLGPGFRRDERSLGFVADPRLPALGLRGYGAEPPANAVLTDEAAYDAFAHGLGVPVAADWAGEKTYPIEANFDLLNGIDFKKGCFVGQETTSRMKRRGTIKTRMLPITFDGPPPVAGAEVLTGELRAGEVLSGSDGQAMALLRLDRIEGVDLTVDGRPVRPQAPAWFPKGSGE